MKLETLTNIVNNLWQDENIDAIVVRLKWEDIAYNMVLDCRDITNLDYDQVEFAINDTITTILLKIMEGAQRRWPDRNLKIGPGIKYVRISNNYLDPKIVECYATLEGRLGDESEEG